ncbi:MAG TPA: hypothetical protein VME46_12815 [Acidimicrobiales bacterium]|nr:hypothetical protein [Acidimicrobiales bacterium]
MWEHFERYVNGLRQFSGVDIALCADIDEPLAQRRAVLTHGP